MKINLTNEKLKHAHMIKFIVQFILKQILAVDFLQFAKFIKF